MRRPTGRLMVVSEWRGRTRAALIHLIGRCKTCIICGSSCCLQGSAAQQDMLRLWKYCAQYNCLYRRSSVSRKFRKTQRYARENARTAEIYASNSCSCETLANFTQTAGRVYTTLCIYYVVQVTIALHNVYSIVYTDKIT